MEKHKLILSQIDRLKPNVRCNGKLLKMKKLPNGAYEAEYDAPNDGTPLEFNVFKHYILSDKLWYIYGLIAWVIGFFGIFTPRWEKKCPSVDLKFTLVDPPAQLELAFYPFNEGYRAAWLHGDNGDAVDNSSNVYFIDKVAQKRAKRVKLFGWLTFLGLLLIAIPIFIILFAT